MSALTSIWVKDSGALISIWVVTERQWPVARFCAAFEQHAALGWMPLLAITLWWPFTCINFSLNKFPKLVRPARNCIHAFTLPEAFAPSVGSRGVVVWAGSARTGAFVVFAGRAGDQHAFAAPGAHAALQQLRLLCPNAADLRFARPRVLFEQWLKHALNKGVAQPFCVCAICWNVSAISYGGLTFAHCVTELLGLSS